MAASGSSLYEELILEANDGSKTIDIRSGAVSVDYYEDIFSPTVTARITVINTGDSVTGNSGKLESIYNGLPLRGGERLSMKIRPDNKSGLVSKKPLDFSSNPNKYLYVSSISDVFSESQRESFTLNLVSREAITNETSRVGKKFTPETRISDSVKDIMNKYLGTSRIAKIDSTQNRYGFIGNMRKPFTVLTWLSAKAVFSGTQNKGTAGFLFYQTQDGFNFRSVDEMIKQPPKATYKYTDVNESSITRPENDLIINQYATEKNQNLVEKLRLGTYASYRIYFNFLTGAFTNMDTNKFTLNQYAGETMGKKVKLPPLEGSPTPGATLADLPTRIISGVLDVGTLDSDVSIKVNADPSEHQTQSIMRYNILFTQTLRMMVPVNTDLRAGDMIRCEFIKVSSGSKELDQEQSGLYMIKELCHHFEPKSSYTSMKLIKDTFGLNASR